MKVKEFIERLKEYDQESEISIYAVDVNEGFNSEMFLSEKEVDGKSTVIIEI